VVLIYSPQKLYGRSDMLVPANMKNLPGIKVRLPERDVYTYNIFNHYLTLRITIVTYVVLK
jgi:hypothetical protein